MLHAHTQTLSSHTQSINIAQKRLWRLKYVVILLPLPLLHSSPSEHHSFQSSFAFILQDYVSIISFCLIVPILWIYCQVK